MNPISHSLFRLFSLAAGLAVVGFSVGSSTSSHSSRSFEANAPDKSEIRGYQNWTRVNREPAMMDAATAVMCAQIVKTQNPHQNKFIDVFVNEIGKHAMLFEKRPRFPEGTVIVKQKLATPNATEPEALTAMIKRGPGYNPEGGDWEYLVASGSGAIISRGRSESCQKCHSIYKETDFVTRLYFSSEDKERLQ